MYFFNADSVVRWTDQRITSTGTSNQRVDRTNEIFSHRWPAFVGGTGGGGSSSKGIQLPAGNYEWPFELVIPGSMAESVEGLPESHIVYSLKATVARGKFAHDIHAPRRPVRIVRTLDPSALELAHEMTVENIWPNKLEYRLVIPQKAVVFGTQIKLKFTFTSLLKGLRIGTIRCTLVENQELSLPSATSQSERTWKNERSIQRWDFEMNEQNYHEVLDDESGQDGYVFSESLPVPKTLRKILQDVDVHGIKVRHRVKFNIALHNPDSHISEVNLPSPFNM